MPRSIWRGVISFGMVSIPVRLFTGTESKDISFRQIHDDDCNARVRQLRWCPVHDREVEYAEIVRGYEYSKDRYVLLVDEDFASLPLPSKHTIDLTAFVELDEIDPVYYEKAYYLEPEEVGAKPFALLSRALEERQLTAIAKIAVRNKERLCALRPREGRLVLETLYYSDEIRLLGESELPAVEVGDDEMAMAFSLIDMLRRPFTPEQYGDEYREALLTVINAKLEGEEVVAVTEAAAATNVVDLMAALKASVEAAQQQQDGATDEAGAAGGKGGRRRRAAAG